MDLSSFEHKKTHPLLTYTGLVSIYIVLLTVVKLWLCQRMELSGDEAYYWVWSKHLDWCYYSKGPGIAWAIALGTNLVGNTELGVRWISVLLGAGTGILLYRLGTVLFSKRVAFWTVIVASTVPLFILGSLVMTIDPLSVFFWTLAAWLFWKNRKRHGAMAWAGAGLAVGLGMLCKYTNVAELICFALFCLWVPAYHREFREPRFWVMIAVALACLTPVVIWNYNYRWITLTHLSQRGALDKKLHFSLMESLRFIGTQFLIFNPLLMIGLIWGLCTMSSEQRASSHYRYLISLFAPLLIFYIFLSLNKAGQANWATPSYIAGVLLLVALWLEKSGKCWLCRFTVALGFLVMVVIHVLPLVSLPQLFPEIKKDPLSRLRGAQNLAQQVVKIQTEQGASFIICDNYQLASLISFYHPDHPQTYLPKQEGIVNQYSFFSDYTDGFWHESAIYVSRSPEIPEQLKREFKTVSLAKETNAMYMNYPMRKHFLFRCDEFGGSPEEDITPTPYPLEKKR